MNVTVQPAKEFASILECECGNTELFVEIMAHEAHLVDGKLNYLHLLDATVDRYLCRICGATVEPVMQSRQR